MENHWFRNGTFYSLDIETYFDSDGDGIGDLKGFYSRLDYIAGLGISCIWLLPFFPSPNRDNGYDVMDYYGVDERLGTLGDLVACIDKARHYGIRIIMDLVVNHTSIQHPWFQEARKDPRSRFREFYVWTDEPLAYEKEHLMFTGEENTMWTFDKEAGQYYLHRFYKEQPDLNIANEEVQEEILKIMGYWLSLGISGFRIDAAEMLIEHYGLKPEDQDKPLKFLNEMRSFLISKQSDAILLAEANVPLSKISTYMEQENRMHMVFNFYLNQQFFLAMAEQNAVRLAQAMQSQPQLNTYNQWLNFLRHHDELTLSLLNEQEKQKVFEAFAPQMDMRIYGRGIRRRLAPMLGGDRDRLELFYSLVFAMPGVALLRYGDEIGMGEDLSLAGRNSVRTPMQWNNEINGGFSTAPVEELVHPVINFGDYGYQKINVMESLHDPSSLLNWMERLISVRKQCPGIGLGSLSLYPSGDPGILVHGFKLEEEQVVFIHNLTPHRLNATLDAEWELLPLFEKNSSSDQPFEELDGFGYKWFRLKKINGAAH